MLIISLILNYVHVKINVLWQEYYLLNIILQRFHLDLSFSQGEHGFNVFPKRSTHVGSELFSYSLCDNTEFLSTLPREINWLHIEFLDYSCFSPTLVHIVSLAGGPFCKSLRLLCFPSQIHWELFSTEDVFSFQKYCQEMVSLYSPPSLSLCNVPFSFPNPECFLEFYLWLSLLLQWTYSLFLRKTHNMYVPYL